MSIQVLIVEDEPVIASDIEMTLSGDDYDIAGIVYTSTAAIDALHRLKLDMVLLDISIKGDKDGIDIAKIINEKYKIPFIYITSFSDKSTLDKAKMTMPYGYIVKPFKDRDIISAIEMAVYRHAMTNNLNLPPISDLMARFGLTSGEYNVLKCVWEGSTNHQVAASLHITLNTVKTHLKNIYTKLDVSSRSEAIAVIRNFKG